MTTELTGADAWDRSLDELSRFRPRELLLPEDGSNPLKEKLARDWPGQCTLDK